MQCGALARRNGVQHGPCADFDGAPDVPASSSSSSSQKVVEAPTVPRSQGHHSRSAQFVAELAMGGEGAEDRGRICPLSSAAAQPTIPPSGNADLKTRAKLYRRAGSTGSDIPGSGLREDLAEVEHKLQREKEDISMEQKEPCRVASICYSDPGATVGAETPASLDDQFCEPAIRKSAAPQSALQESAPAKRDSASRKVVVADDHEVMGERPLAFCQNGRRIDIRKQDCGNSARADAGGESDKLPPVTDSARPASRGAASDSDSAAGSDAAVVDPEECDWTVTNAVNPADLKNISKIAGDDMMMIAQMSGKSAGDSMMQKLSSMSGRSGKASASQDGRPGTGSGIRGALGTARNAIASILPSRAPRGDNLAARQSAGGMAQQLLQSDPGSFKGDEPTSKHTAHSGSALEPRSLREELAQRNLPTRVRNRGENSQAAIGTSGSADAAADRSHRERRRHRNPK